MIQFASLLTTGRLKTILGVACAVVCFGTGYKIKALSAERVIAEVKAEYAQITAEALEDANRQIKEGVERYQREVEALQRTLASREADLNTLRMSRSDLTAQLERLHSTIRDLNSREVPKSIAKAGTAYESCWRAVNDLRRMVREGAKLHGEGAELLGELTDELGEVLVDRKATLEMINAQRLESDKIK